MMKWRTLIAVLLLCLAVAYRASGQTLIHHGTNSCINCTSVSVTNSTQQSGSLLWITAYCEGPDTNPRPTVTDGLDTLVIDANGNISAQGTGIFTVSHTCNSNAGSNTITATANSTELVCLVTFEEWTGEPTTGCLLQNPGGRACVGGCPAQLDFSPDVTTTVANELVLGFAAVSGDGTTTATVTSPFSPGEFIATTGSGPTRNYSIGTDFDKVVTPSTPHSQMFWSSGTGSFALISFGFGPTRLLTKPKAQVY